MPLSTHACASRARDNPFLASPRTALVPHAPSAPRQDSAPAPDDERGHADAVHEAAEFAHLRVLIVHDWITSWAGAERVVEQMLLVFPQATLVVGLIDRTAVPVNGVTRRAHESWLGRIPFAARRHRWLLPLYPAAFSALDTAGYDLVISSAHAFAKSVRTSSGTPHLCYCHTPPRYLWDLHDTYTRDGGLGAAALSLARPVLREIDRRSARRVDRFVANSEYIADRIRRCYGREAAVVYPPVAAKPAVPAASGRGGALLSFGRLVPYKRVDLAVQAANAAGLPLIVAGDGPERPRLERLAGPTVTFLGDVSEGRAGELMEHARALLFCAEEDFGITPVEANAHGLPVVAYGRGAALESMREGVTAEFFGEQTPRSLLEAIERATHRSWDDTAIRGNAARFSPRHFRAGLAAQVREML